MDFSKHFLSLRDYFLTGEKFKIFQDPHTGLMKTVPQPPREKLCEYYKSEDYLSHQDDAKSAFAKAYKAVKRQRLKAKAKTVKKYVQNGRHLDIGTGTGDLVKFLHDSGVSSTGVELEDNARKIASRKQIRVFKDTQNLDDGMYSVVTMYHVLEHVDDLKEQVQELRRLISPDGYLILALPNYDSADAKIFQEHWAGYDVPRHLYHFNDHAVEHLFSNQFKVIESKKQFWDAYYVSILSARYKNWPLPVISGSLVATWSNLLAIFTEQTSARLYILKISS